MYAKGVGFSSGGAIRDPSRPTPRRPTTQEARLADGVGGPIPHAPPRARAARPAPPGSSRTAGNSGSTDQKPSSVTTHTIKLSQPGNSSSQTSKMHMGRTVSKKTLHDSINQECAILSQGTKQRQDVFASRNHLRRIDGRGVCREELGSDCLFHARAHCHHHL